MGGEPGERKGGEEFASMLDEDEEALEDGVDEESTDEDGPLFIPSELSGLRTDRALVELFPQYSRARLQQWLRDGTSLRDGAAARPRDPVHGGERVELTAVPEPETEWGAEPVDFRIAYEDEDLIIVDKPAGLVVHPGAGNPRGTLVNGLLHYAPELEYLPRAGIVHRIDKDTSGLLAVARTLEAHKSLVDQLQERTMGREYEAVVCGVMTAGGTVDLPIGRHPVQRTRMAVRESGKPAITHYRVVERYRSHAWIRVRLETGRTHQIRVHMAHIHHPLVGDPEYGRLRLPAGASEELHAVLRSFRRQALHAAKIGLHHPRDGGWREWNSPLPQDMADLVEALRKDASGDASGSL
jgi:23S rRNA pseudouridine1911/1915/1917 synthase